MRPKSHYRHMTKEKADWARQKYFSREMKQAEIAKILGIRQNSVSRIISGAVWA